MCTSNSTTTHAVLHQLNTLEGSLTADLPRLSDLPVSIATAQLLLEMRRARNRYEQLLEDARNNRMRSAATSAQPSILEDAR